MSCPYAEKEHIRSERKAYDPRPLSMRNTSLNDVDEFKKQLQDLPTKCAFLHLLCKPDSTIAAVTPSESLPLVPRSVQCRVRDKLFKMPLPPTYEVLQELGKEFIDAITPNSEQRTNIEKKTHTQATCARWHEERLCRLTASNFGAVIKCKSNHIKLAHSLLENKVLSTVLLLICTALRWLSVIHS